MRFFKKNYLCSNENYCAEQSTALPPAIAATIVGAPNIAAIPAVIPIIKPQETLPVKKPIPTEITAKAANALPPFPVTTLSALQRVSTNALLSASAVTDQIQPVPLVLQVAGEVIFKQVAGAAVLSPLHALESGASHPKSEQTAADVVVIDVQVYELRVPVHSSALADETGAMEIKNRNIRERRIFFIAYFD
ncbi:MAG: hypothetical protein ACJAZX_000736 [Rickettsiales bacterium]|jgi:hypothetical protein